MRKGINRCPFYGRTFIQPRDLYLSSMNHYDLSVRAGLREARQHSPFVSHPEAPGHRVATDMTARVRSRRPANWIDPDYVYGFCNVTSEEWDKALKTARRELLRGKKPVRSGETPHLILTIGAPGAGKSTVAAAVAKERGSGDYVTVDLDVAVKYHPRYLGVWGVPDVATGKPTGVGMTTEYLVCNNSLIDILVQIISDLLEAKKYNIIFQSHSQFSLIEAKMSGYRTTLLFVGVPLKTAIQRSRDRAIKTGKFLASNLAIQDEHIYSMWSGYRVMAAWYGLWADEFLVADNSRTAKDSDAASHVSKRIKEIPLRCAPESVCTSWEDRFAVAQKAIDEACGV